jgi:hypothetical protein
MKIGQLIPRVLVITLLVAASTWLIQYGQIRRLIYQKNYSYNATEAARLESFAAAMYDYGRLVQFLNNSDAAASYYRQAVSADPLHISAWLELAEVERDRGNIETARKIVKHAHGLTRRVKRWKWAETLLAYELEFEPVFRENINYLVSTNKITADALRLLDAGCSGKSEAVLAALQPENRAAYLKWLMRWRRVNDARMSWTALREKDRKEPALRLSYIHFLVSHKQVAEALDLWRDQIGAGGMTNAGFEEETLRSGFGWRNSDHREGLWKAQRVRDRETTGNHVMRISFSGKENISFHHLSQVVPVDGRQSYRLSYRYCYENISTDQGPFVEVHGYDCQGLYEKGPMMLGSSGWQENAIAFTAGKECSAVVVRVRRLPSRRFDSKIAGTLWLDDFQLDSVRNASRDYRAGRSGSPSVKTPSTKPR